MSEREKLKKLAEAATQGTWKASETPDYGKENGHHSYREISSDKSICWIAKVQRFDDAPITKAEPEYEANCQYIAAANPSTILALLSELEQAERERDEASAEAAACLKFLSNTLQWEGFRLEMLTEKDDVKKSNSHQENIRLLSNYLAEKGHGIKFLAALRTLREASACSLAGPLVRESGISSAVVKTLFPSVKQAETFKTALAAALAAEGGK